MSPFKSPQTSLQHNDLGGAHSGASGNERQGAAPNGSPVATSLAPVAALTFALHAAHRRLDGRAA